MPLRCLELEGFDLVPETDTPNARVMLRAKEVLVEWRGRGGGDQCHQMTMAFIGVKWTSTAAAHE